MTPALTTRVQIFLPFALGYFLSYLFRVINAVLAPDLAAELGVDASQLGLLTAAYLIAFASFQMPLGVLLDRFGPRVVESLLLLVAAAGAWVFGHATSLTGLIVGRSLIGFGVSACLMAAFKAFVLWFPRQQLPQINGFQMASGGLGAIVAMAPVQAALSVTDWRGIFSWLAVVTALVAVAIYLIVPERGTAAANPRWREQVRGMGTIAASMAFWRVAPLATLSQATFMAIHGLWAGPWLHDVAGLSREQTAQTLSLVAVAMVVGYIGLGTAAERLSRRGIAPMAIATAGMCLFMLQLLLLILRIEAIAVPIYILFGFFGTSGVLVYAVLSQSFPAHLAGRVNTALNLLVFVAAFASQWGIGAVIEFWPTGARGEYAPEGYSAAFGILLVLQIISLAWCWLAGRFTHRPG